MVLRSLKQQQRSLIKVIIRLLQTMRPHLRYQLAKPVIQQAWIINNDMSLTFVSLVNAKNLGADGGFNLIGHLTVDEIFHRPLFPVRIQHIAIEMFILFADVKTVLRTGWKLLQLFKQPVRIHFRRHNARTRFNGTVSGNQFLITNRNLNVLKNICGGFRPTQNNRLSLRLLVAGGI